MSVKKLYTCPICCVRIQMIHFDFTKYVLLSKRYITLFTFFFANDYFGKDYTRYIFWLINIFSLKNCVEIFTLDEYLLNLSYQI